MKQCFFIIFLILFTPFLIQVNTTFAQENNSQIVQQKIIVQTDTEENVPNHQITCRKIPRKLGNITEDEITVYELTTDENGETFLETILDENFTYSCSSLQKTTADYCWYFPYQSQSFGYVSDKNDNRPVYLVAQKSPETCNRQLTQAEIENGIDNLLPTGTPEPFKNKNLIVPTPTPESEVLQTTEFENSDITLWQWFVAKIKAIFGK